MSVSVSAYNSPSEIPAHARLAARGDAFNTVVRESLRPTANGGVVLFLVFSICHMWFLPPGNALVMTCIAFSTAMVFLVLRLWLQPSRVALEWAHPIAVGMCLLVLGNSLSHLAIAGDIKHTSNIAIYIIGLGGLLLSSRWFYGTLVASLVGWGTLLIWLPPAADLGHYVFMLLGALMLSMLLHAARTRSISRLHELHLQDEQQQYALQQGVAALQAKQLVLNEAKDQAEEANRAKTEFVAMVTHELKTPLTVILGFADLMTLYEDISAANIETSAQAIRNNAKHMQTLLVDLSNLSEVDHHDFCLLRELVLLPVVLQAMSNAYIYQASARGINIVTQIDDVDCYTFADSTRLMQILHNVIGNAVKYTLPGGTVTISAHQNQPVGFVQIAVSDTGIGMSSADQQHVFQRFFRAESARQQAIAGTGLGLYITRRLVELHGGQIWLESELGHGSTMHLLLPIAELSERSVGL